MAYKDPEYFKHYYQAHKDKMKADVKEYVQSHPEQYAEYRHSSHRKNWEKEWRKRHSEELRDRRLRLRYGIGLNEFNELFSLQQGRCAICGASGKQLMVDHDHEAGNVRGLLCNDCNVALGRLKDNVEILQRAIGYLQTSKDIRIRGG